MGGIGGWEGNIGKNRFIYQLIINRLADIGGWEKWEFSVIEQIIILIKILHQISKCEDWGNKNEQKNTQAFLHCEIFLYYKSDY